MFCARAFQCRTPLPFRIGFLLLLAPKPGPEDEAKRANEETQSTVAWLRLHPLPPTKKYIRTQRVIVIFVIGVNLNLL